MSSSGISSVDLRVIEGVLQMGGGYVLDFSNRTFAEFFKDYGVDIDDQRFLIEGSSKANRLRCFLHTVGPPLSGRVLAGLLELRLLSKPEGLRPTHLDRFRAVARALGGETRVASSADSPELGAAAEAALLRQVFKPESFGKLSIEATLTQALVERMNEAQRCIDARAYLSAVILCGSVLEGMCLGFGLRDIERANRAYSARFNKPAKPLHEWRLAEWIDVLASIGDLSPNVEKFGHGLRDFRNYVHPAEQIANRFSPNQHTALIGFQVVVAAAEDLASAATRMNWGTK